MFKKDRKKKTFKIILNAIVLLLIIGLVLYFSLKDNYKEIIKELSKMNFLFIIITILLYYGYKTFMGLSLYEITVTNNQKYTKSKAIMLSFITQFFNSITPYATGGQPAQIYYLKKDGVGVASSTNIITQNFLVYQIALILFGILAVVYNAIFNIFPDDTILKKLVLIGFIVNFGVCVFLCLVSFGKKFNSFIVNKLIAVLGKIRIIKNVDNTKKSAREKLENFYKNGLKLKKNKRVLIKTCLYNFLALLCLYSIPVIIIYGFNDYSSVSYINSVVAVAHVMIMGAFVPTPGGAGGLEYGFMSFFGYFITNNALLTATMLLWRGATYYLGLLTGGIVLLIDKRRRKNESRNI